MRGLWTVLALLALLGGLRLAALEATLLTNGRLRATPDLTATDNTITVLSAGSRVAVVGGDEEWLEVVCPELASVWVHRRNLRQQAEDPRRFEVLDDGVHMRLDSRITAPALPSTLSRGQTVLWAGIRHGDLFIGKQTDEWYAVHVPGMRAWLHRSLVEQIAGGMPPAGANAAAAAGGPAVAGGAGGAEPAAAAVPAEMAALWEGTHRDYERLQGASAAGAEVTMVELDALIARLQRVVADHPRIRSRLLADRMIRELRRLQAQLRAGLPLAPPAAADPGREAVADPEPEADPVPPTAPAAVPPAQPPIQPALPTPDPVPPIQPRVPGPVATSPPAPPPVEAPAAVDATGVPPDAAAPAAVADGTWISLAGAIEERQVPDHAVHHVLMAPSGEVIALLRVDPQSSLRLWEWRWRQVTVSGRVKRVQAELGGRPHAVPLLEVALIESR